MLKPGKKVTVCWDGARLPTLDNGCPSCRRGAACRLVCSSTPRGLSPPQPQPRFSAQDQAEKLLIVEDSWRNSGSQLAPRLDDATSQPHVPRSGVFGPISATVLRWLAAARIRPCVAAPSLPHTCTHFPHHSRIFDRPGRVVRRVLCPPAPRVAATASMSLLHRDLPQPPPTPRLSPRPCRAGHG